MEKKKNKVTLEAIAGLIEKSSEDMRKYVGGELQKSSEDMRKYVGGELQKSSESTKKDLREFVSDELEKSSESTKKYVRDHVGGEIEKLAVLVVNRFDQVDEKIDKLTETTKNSTKRINILEFEQQELAKKQKESASLFDLGKMGSTYERRCQRIEAKIGLKLKEK